MTKAELEQLKQKWPTGMCSCGHTQPYHTQVTKYRDRPNNERAPGHGYCAAANCVCPQFTWVRWADNGETAKKEGLP